MKSISEIIMKHMPKIDKLAHFYIGFFLSVIGLLIDHLFIQQNLLVLVIPFLAALIKESCDKWLSGSKWDWRDITYTVLPSVIIYIILLLK